MELKPCPFCGAAMAERHSWNTSRVWYHPDGECVLSDATFKVWENDIPLWNTRASGGLEGAIDALREIQPTADQIESDSDMFQAGRACGIEDAKDAIRALPFGGLGQAVEVVERHKRRYEREGLHSAPFQSLCLRILEDLRALPDSGEVELLAAAVAVEQWWVDEGQHRFGGAPAAIFALRQALAGTKP